MDNPEVTNPEEAAPAAEPTVIEIVDTQADQPQTDAPDVQSPAAEPEVDWERRYHSAHGRLTAQNSQHTAFETDAREVINKANAEIMTLRTDLSEARAQIAELESLKPPPPTPEDMVDSLGQEAADAIWHNFAHHTSQSQPPVTFQDDPEEPSQTPTSEQPPYEPPEAASFSDRQLEVFSYLDSRMVDWEATLKKSEFKDWARSAVNPSTNRTYGDEFNDANAAYDGAGLLNVFTAYKQSKGTNRPPADSIIPVTPGGTGSPSTAPAEIPPMTESRYKALRAARGRGDKQAAQELKVYHDAVTKSKAHKEALAQQPA
jgi:hypothetical protein